MLANEQERRSWSNSWPTDKGGDKDFDKATCIRKMSKLRDLYPRRVQRRNFWFSESSVYRSARYCGRGHRSDVYHTRRGAGQDRRVCSWCETFYAADIVVSSSRPRDERATGVILSRLARLHSTSVDVRALECRPDG
jgi:hypothetical protein